MVTGEVLVVLGEQLRVLEGDDRAVDGLYHGAGVIDGTHLTFRAVALYPVAYLDASRHKGYSVVDVLEYVFHGETDTCGETSGDNDEPCVVHLHYSKTDKQPRAPHQYLQYIAHHNAATACRPWVFFLEILRCQR